MSDKLPATKPGTSQQQFLADWIESGRDVQEISREEWMALERPSPDAIVGGEMYPSCIACFEGGAPCLWEFHVLQNRMEYLKPDFSCEGCRLNMRECLFVWGVEDSMKKIGDAMNRLVRHFGSQLRKIDRRAIEEEIARKEVEKEIAELPKK